MALKPKKWLESSKIAVKGVLWKFMLKIMGDLPAAINDIKILQVK